MCVPNWNIYSLLRLSVWWYFKEAIQQQKKLQSCAEIKIAMIKGVKASIIAGPVCAVVAWMCISLSSCASRFFLWSFPIQAEMDVPLKTAPGELKKGKGCSSSLNITANAQPHYTFMSLCSFILNSFLLNAVRQVSLPGTTTVGWCARKCVRVCAFCIHFSVVSISLL